jgi:hypothetical protein
MRCESGGVAVHTIDKSRLAGVDFVEVIARGRVERPSQVHSVDVVDRLRTIRWKCAGHVIGGRDSRCRSSRLPTHVLLGGAPTTADVISGLICRIAIDRLWCRTARTAVADLIRCRNDRDREVSGGATRRPRTIRPGITGIWPCEQTKLPRRRLRTEIQGLRWIRRASRRVSAIGHRWI